MVIQISLSGDSDAIELRSNHRLFAVLIKALIGKSTSIYIRSIRLEKARELLRTTDLNVSEVAYEVGFRTSTYFTQVFSEEVGVAPSVFRA